MVHSRNRGEGWSMTREGRESIGRCRDKTIVAGLGENSFLFGGTDRQAPW